MDRPWGYSLHHPSAAGTFNTNHGGTRRSRRPLQQLAISELEESEGGMSPGAGATAAAAAASQSNATAVAAVPGRKRLGRAAHRQFGSFLMTPDVVTEQRVEAIESLAHVQQLLWEDDGSGTGSGSSASAAAPVPRSVTTGRGTFVTPQPFVRRIDPLQRERMKGRIDLLPPAVQPHPLSREANDPAAMQGLSRSRHMLPSDVASSHQRLPAQMDELDIGVDLPPLPSDAGASPAELSARRFPIHMNSRGQQLQSELLALIRPLAGKGPAQISPDTVARMQILSRELRAANSNAIMEGESSNNANGDDLDDDSLYPASLRALAMQTPLTSFESATGPLLELLAPHVRSALSALSIASRKRREQLESQRPWHQAAGSPPPARPLDSEAATAADLCLAHTEEKQHSPRRRGGSVSPRRGAVASAAPAPVEPAYATSRSLALGQSLTASGTSAHHSKWSQKGPLVSPRDRHRIPYQSARTSHARTGRIERADSQMPAQAPVAQPQPLADSEGGVPADRVIVHSQLFVDDVPSTALMRAGLAHLDEVLAGTKSRTTVESEMAATAATGQDSVGGWRAQSPIDSGLSTPLLSAPFNPSVLPFPSRTGSREGLRSQSRSRSRSPQRVSSYAQSPPLVPPKAAQFFNRSRPRSREVSPARGTAYVRSALSDPSPLTAPTCPPALGPRPPAPARAARDEAFLVSLLEELLPDVEAWKQQQGVQGHQRLRRDKREQIKQQMTTQVHEEKQERAVSGAEAAIPFLTAPHVSAVPADSNPSPSAEPGPTGDTPADASHAVFDLPPPAAAAVAAAAAPLPARPPSPPRLASARTVASLFDALLAPSTSDDEKAAGTTTTASHRPDVLRIDRSHDDDAAGANAGATVTTTVQSGASLSLEVSGRVAAASHDSDQTAVALRAAAAASEAQDGGPAALAAVSAVAADAARPTTSRRASGASSNRSSQSSLPRHPSRRDAAVTLSTSASLPAPALPVSALADSSSARLVAGVTAINRRRSTTTEHKKTFLALRFSNPAAPAAAATATEIASGIPSAIPAAPGPDHPRAPLVIDLHAETEKLRWWEQHRAALQRRVSQDGSSNSETGRSECDHHSANGSESGTTLFDDASAPDLSSLRLPPVDAPNSARLTASSSPQSDVNDDARGRRSHTHSIITPHTQSRLVALLTRVQPQPHLPPRGSQSARSVLQRSEFDRSAATARTTLLQSGHGAFTRSLAPVTAAASLMRPRAPTPPPQSDALPQHPASPPPIDPSSHCNSPVPGSSETSLPLSLPSSAETATLHSELLSLLSSRPRSLLLLRRLAAELADTRSGKGHASTAPLQLRRLLLPRLESRLAVQLRSLRLHTAAVTRSLDRWAVAYPLQPTFVHQHTDVRAQMRIEMDYLDQLQTQLLDIQESVNG